MPKVSSRRKVPEPAFIDTETDDFGLRGPRSKLLEQPGFVRGLRDKGRRVSYKARCVVNDVVQAPVRLSNTDAVCQGPERRPYNGNAGRVSRRKCPSGVRASCFGYVDEIEASNVLAKRATEP